MSYATSRPVPSAISAGLFSLSAHVLVLLLLLAAAALVVPLPPNRPPHHTTWEIDLRPPLRLPQPATSKGGTRGGGAADPRPVQKGRLPEPKPARVFVAPMVAVVQTPKLAVDLALAVLPDLDVPLGAIGAPDGLVSTGGFGSLGDRGIGTGAGDSFGPGNDREGRGGNSQGPGGVLKVTRAPQLIYKLEPEYSEEARRAHVQGKVRLLVEVGLDGRAKNIRVIQGMGMGLDQNAIEAVSKWIFEPALAGSQPVVTTATIEVGFHLI